MYRAGRLRRVFRARGELVEGCCLRGHRKKVSRAPQVEGGRRTRTGLLVPCFASEWRARGGTVFYDREARSSARRP